MAIQFRTRTKSAINYSTELKSIGVCCGIDGSKTSKTFLECFQSGGNFQYGNINEVDCISPGATGCCCSCSNETLEGSLFNGVADPNLLTQCGGIINNNRLGLVNGTSKCECERLGGVWNQGPCPTNGQSATLDPLYGLNSILIGNSTADKYCGKLFPVGDLLSGEACLFDVRVPRSCCYMDRDDNNVPTKVICENVCKSSDCMGYTASNQPAIFSKKKLCNADLLGNGTADCTSSSFLSYYSTGTALFDDFSHGPCFRLKKTNNTYSYDCELTSKELCEEYWTELLDDSKVCNHNYAPQVPTKTGSRIIEPETMSEYSFNLLGLNIGATYKGGIYMGIYEPGSPITPTASDIFGAEQLTQKTGTLLKSNASGPGEKENKKWAIIVEPSIYFTTFLDAGEQLQTSQRNLSKYDGFYNFYGDNRTFNGIKTKLTNTICGKNRKGFADFYVPSLKELQFFAKQYQVYVSGVNNYIIPRGAFMTSSMYNEKLLYSQYLTLSDSYNYGRVILSAPTTNLSILFFRRILLT